MRGRDAARPRSDAEGAARRRAAGRHRGLRTAAQLDLGQRLRERRRLRHRQRQPVATPPRHRDGGRRLRLAGRRSAACAARGGRGCGPGRAGGLARRGRRGRAGAVPQGPGLRRRLSRRPGRAAGPGRAGLRHDRRRRRRQGSPRCDLEPEADARDRGRGARVRRRAPGGRGRRAAARRSLPGGDHPGRLDRGRPLRGGGRRGDNGGVHHGLRRRRREGAAAAGGRPVPGGRPERHVHRLPGPDRGRVLRRRDQCGLVAGRRPADALRRRRPRGSVRGRVGIPSVDARGRGSRRASTARIARASAGTSSRTRRCSWMRAR